ncbi:hypothetical protein H4582DRAFT_2174405 [Lactarius indigo]|nr:hypothetical protein H4582DRAFT_2174405 [Lactarius indigo]
MSPAKSSQVVVDEETPLIHDSYAQRKPTPLPNTQLFLHLVRLEELIMSHSINPTSTSDLSIRHLPLTDLQWSRVSNHIGRKSILLLGPEGSVVPTILFGLSRSSCALFSGAPGLCSPPAHTLTWRHSQSLFDRRLEWQPWRYSMPAELADEINVAREFSLSLTARMAGYIIWGRLVATARSLARSPLSSFLGQVPLSPAVHRDCWLCPHIIVIAMYLEEKKSVTQTPKQDPEGPLPLRALLTRPVLVSVSSYGMLDMAAMTLIPLVWVTPVELGGIDSDLDPTSTGMWTSGYGRLNGPVQFTSFPCVIARLGPGHVFLTSVLVTFSVDIQVRSRNDRVAGSE